MFVTPRPTHRTRPNPAKPALLRRSWHPAHFFFALLSRRIIYTTPSAAQEENALGTQVRGAWTQRKTVRERGDTIVEVLIAIAVISTVLAGAYVTTNRSLQATRSAEEQGNALKLVESQVEQIKSMAKTNADDIFGSGAPNPFCVTQSQTVVSASNAACRVDASGAPASDQPIYNLSVERSGNFFRVSNTWEDVSGRSTDEVNMVYRAYE